MLEKIKAWINYHRLLPSGGTVLAACSGGPDSLVLVHILYVLRSEYDITVAVAHVDHMFRGEESAQDSEFVADFCKKLGLACYQTAINVPAYIKESGRSPQDCARVLRYEYLRQVAQTLGGAKIATGHHRDDQAETVLINLIRGAGAEGLSGIKPANNGIIRPLLAISRKEIEHYCHKEGLIPRLDSSNFKTYYLRNRVRLSLLPELESGYNPAIKEALWRTAVIVSDEHDFVHITAKNMWQQIVGVKQDIFAVDIRRLASLHVALQREIFRMVIEKIQGNLTGITFYHVEKLLEMAFKGTVGSIMELPGGLIACKGYQTLELGKSVPIAAPVVIHPPGLRLAVPGTTFIPEFGCRVNARLLTAGLKPDNLMTALFDWQVLRPPLYVRTRVPGDRFNPLGMQGSKKLKDFFIDVKIPREERERALIFCDSQGIVWIGGYRQAEQAKVTGRTRQFLELTIEYTGGAQQDDQ